jgi:hypothetical protein
MMQVATKTVGFEAGRQGLKRPLLDYRGQVAAHGI